ncbi:S-adenosyl-L-methionine dependent methyltransferase [Rhodofomes roseus]|uniref:S-adenosyl-L-methionine dependent methyltransferase n=1 Tax=Rhodofomes roseus TaxID=34475 RepID=A0ABQ8K805_9APHY|nr:S-adenosyl-L-methionine dependent methyltransferase [Rhodofomes roseus]KAH9833054.1 S-adenosyl-L-methionine dependent methyltransferase [Rhodofomes roseus]
MHPRNPYRTAPDFASLTDVYPALKPHLLTTPSGVSIDFQNETSQRRLTEALLQRDFNLSINLPEDRLCPPVPNRLNYVLWIQDIVHATYLTEPSNPLRTITGVDIGTGASAIYPLLGCQSNVHWRFVATDIDGKSLHYAQLNIHGNNLQSRMKLVKSEPGGPILRHVLTTTLQSPSLSTTEMSFDFTMCNPPFYSSKDDVQRSAEAKEYQPNAVCTGADVEMITPGGEAAFVCKMVSESLELRTRCRWYTSMLGKLSSLTEVVNVLHGNKIDNYAVTEFVQGQTRRWAIAWSFGDVHLPDSIARISSPSVHSLMPAHNTVQQTYPQSTSSLDHLSSVVASILSSVESVSTRPLIPRDDETASSALTGADVLVTAARDTWSRAARRRKMREAVMQVDEELSVALVCRVACAALEEDDPAARARGVAESLVLQCHWVKGSDRGLFESFASHLSRKVSAAL